MDKIGSSKFSKLKKNLKNTAIGLFTAFCMVSCDDFETFEHPRLTQLFEQDVPEFSNNAANNPIMQKILESRGVNNGQAWFESRMRDGGKYMLSNDIEFGGVFLHPSRRIAFSSVDVAESLSLRAHEMAHRVSHEELNSGSFRIGFVSGSSQNRSNLRGRGLNEGMTDLMSAKFMGLTIDEYAVEEWISSTPQRILALEFRNALDCDKTLFESFFFDHRILEKEFNNRRGNNQDYARFIDAFDAFHNHNYRTIRNAQFFRESTEEQIAEAHRTSRELRAKVVEFINMLSQNKIQNNATIPH